MEIKESYSTIFKDKTIQNIKIHNLIFKNYISRKGDVKKEVEFCIEAIKNSLKEYRWRIPLSFLERKEVFGFLARTNKGELLDHKLYYCKNNDTEIDNKNSIYALIKIILPIVNKGERITIRLEYYLKGAATIQRRNFLKNIFYKLWKFPWRYIIVNKTQKLDYRITLPLNCKFVNIESNLKNDSPLSMDFNFDEKEMKLFLLMKEKLPFKKVISGDIYYKQILPTLITLICLISGLIITSFISMIFDGWSPLNFIKITIFLFFGIWGTVYCIRKIS